MFEVSTLTLIGLALAIVVVLLALRGLHALIELVPMSRTRRQSLKRRMPILEVTAVVVLIIGAVPRLVGGNPQISAITLGAVLLAVIGVTWSSLRDLAAGVVFRASSPAAVGDLVRVGEITGRVVRVGYRTLELETEVGEQALIPMSRVARDAIHRVQQEERVLHRFRVQVPERMGAAEARERARVAALLSHWSAISREPEVLEISSTELDVKVYALGPSRGGEIEALVRRALVE